MYMFIEHCPSNYLVRNFHLNSKGSVNIHKTKIQMAYIEVHSVHDGKLFSVIALATI